MGTRSGVGEGRRTQEGLERGGRGGAGQGEEEEKELVEEVGRGERREGRSTLFMSLNTPPLP